VCPTSGSIPDGAFHFGGEGGFAVDAARDRGMIA